LARLYTVLLIFGAVILAWWGVFGVVDLACGLGTGACQLHGCQQIGHRVPIFFDVAEVRRLGLSGAWVKHSPPKRLRNASAVAVSGKQNRIWNCSASCRFRPRRTGMRRLRWNASISRKALRKPPGGNVSSTRCGKSRSFVRPMISRLRRVISPNPPPLRASLLVRSGSSF
jgi:hypothetical protein